MVAYRMSTEERTLTVEVEICDGRPTLYLNGFSILELTNEGKLALLSQKPVDGIQYDSAGRLKSVGPEIIQGTPLMALLNVAKEMFCTMRDYSGNAIQVSEQFKKNCTIWKAALCEAERLTT